MQAKVLESTNELSRNEWLTYRKNGIGGSDAAAVCGLSRWKSPMSVWLDKTGLAEPEEPGESAYWGTVMEPIIREEFTRRTGIAVREVSSILQHPQYPHMLANLDGIVTDNFRGEGIFEAKTAGIYSMSEWEAGIPDEYAIQIQHYLAVTGLSYAYVAVLIGGNKFLWKPIERDDEVIHLIVQLEARFWKLVVNGTPPELDGSKATTELLNHLYRISGRQTRIELPDEAAALIQEYEKYQEEEQRAQERMDTAANQLKGLLGEAELGIIGDRQVTWKTIKSERLDSKALRADHPEIHKKYVKESSYRRFSIK